MGDTTNERYKMRDTTNIETEGKYIANALYNGTVTTLMAAGIAEIGKKINIGSPPKLDFGGKDLLMVIVDMSIANMIKAWLVKQGVLPANIMN